MNEASAPFVVNNLPNSISISGMDESKFSALLIFLIANYFLTFLIIGLLAAVISLSNKPKPLTINVVSEALFSYRGSQSKTDLVSISKTCH
jgi:hypothetical protein